MGTREIRDEESSPPVRLQVGGDAFPTFTEDMPGLSVLDYFAAKAMVPLIDCGPSFTVDNRAALAALAYDIAAAMLTERDHRNRP